MTVARNKYTHILDYLDSLFWQEKQIVNYSAHTFYIFKPFPSELSSSEKKEWSNLQAEVLSPFARSFHYYYVSQLGVHLWFSKAELNGLPETASQGAMSDGLHTVKGRHFCYQQRWHNRVMIDCISAPAEQQDSDRIEVLPSGNAWAVQRRLYDAVKKPYFWSKLSLAITAVTFLYIISGALIVWSQTTWLQEKSQQLSEQIGPKLQQRQQLSQATETISQITDWYSEFGNIPVALSKTLTTFVDNENIVINTMQWQNKQLNLEFAASQINITQLVEMAQDLEGVRNAQIKPNNQDNTWVLEVQW